MMPLATVSAASSAAGQRRIDFRIMASLLVGQKAAGQPTDRPSTTADFLSVDTTKGAGDAIDRQALHE
jgi:hypothetical protein